MRLPSDSGERKKIPLSSLFDYFDLALTEVSKVIYAGNAQHNPGAQIMVWDRSKSTDQADCLFRHFIDRGELDTDGMRHSAKLAWRALAMLQLEMEAALNLPPSRASKNYPLPEKPWNPEPPRQTTSRSLDDVTPAEWDALVRKTGKTAVPKSSPEANVRAAASLTSPVVAVASPAGSETKVPVQLELPFEVYKLVRGTSPTTGGSVVEIAPGVAYYHPFSGSLPLRDKP